VTQVAETAGGADLMLHLAVEIEGITKPGCFADVLYRYSDR
jgi:hypothetical protein